MIGKLIRKTKEVASKAWYRLCDFYESDFGREVLQPALENSKKLAGKVFIFCLVCVAVLALLILLVYLVELWWPLIFAEILAVAFIINMLFNYSDYRKRMKRRGYR